jgi:hypothetical protein
MGTEVILDLNTLVPDRPLVRIVSALHPDGKMYGMRVRDELSIFQVKTVENMARRVAEFADRDITTEESKLMDQYLEDLLDIEFHDPLEPEVREGLDVHHRISILATFNTVCLRRGQQTTEELPADLSTGES